MPQSKEASPIGFKLNLSIVECLLLLLHRLAALVPLPLLLDISFSLFFSILNILGFSFLTLFEIAKYLHMGQYADVQCMHYVAFPISFGIQLL